MTTSLEHLPDGTYKVKVKDGNFDVCKTIEAAFELLLNIHEHRHFTKSGDSFGGVVVFHTTDAYFRGYNLRNNLENVKQEKQDATPGS
jgi:hypothetical protein